MLERCSRLGNYYRRSMRRRGILCFRSVRRNLMHNRPAADISLGLMVKERNYLDVYPYDKWSDKELPNFEEGQTFMPSVCELRDSQTTRPNLLTEADLVTLMDKNGIGKKSFLLSRATIDRLICQVPTPRLPSIYKRSSTANT